MIGYEEGTSTMRASGLGEAPREDIRGRVTDRLDLDGMELLGSFNSKVREGRRRSLLHIRFSTSNVTDDHICAFRNSKMKFEGG